MIDCLTASIGKCFILEYCVFLIPFEDDVMVKNGLFLIDVIFY